MAIPTIPAPASSGATLTPISLSAVKPTTDDSACQPAAQHGWRGCSRAMRVVAVARQRVDLAIHQAFC